MKFGLRRKASDIFVIIYIALTLWVRFLLEPQLQGQFLISIGIGLFALLFLWALAKSRIINPGWFGLFGNKEEKGKQY
jgi:hypothetical protein